MAKSSKKRKHRKHKKSALGPRDKPGEIRAPQAADTEAALLDRIICRGRAGAAEFAGVTTRTISNWQRDGMVTYRDGETVIYLKALLAERKEGRGHELSADIKREQTVTVDYKEAKARLMQLELEIRRGEWLRKEHIQRGRIERIGAVKRGLLNLARKLPALLEGRSRKQMQQTIRKEMVHLINVYAGLSGREAEQ